MTILVTGGAGYIGSHTCVELLNAGYSIVVVDNLCNSKEEAINGIKRITGADFDFYKADIRDETAMTKIFERHSANSTSPISGIIHFAGLKAVGESVEKPILYYDNNINSTLVLCKLIKQFGVKCMIFSSSATVYRPDNPMPLTEDAVLGPINPYGQTKFMCEQIIRDAVTAHPQCSAILLRYFNPVGAHESGIIGENPQGIPNNLMPFIAQTAMGLQKELKVFGNDYDTIDGTGVRDYIHVVCLAKGHVKAIEYAINHSGCEAINLGTGQGISVMQMLEAFQKINQVKINCVIAPRRPGDAAVSYADPSKALNLLGWKAEKNLNDMCADTWRFQSQT